MHWHPSLLPSTLINHCASLLPILPHPHTPLSLLLLSAFLLNPKSNHSPFCNHHNPLTIMMSHKVSNKHHTPFPCSCPLLPNPFLFLFSLCHSTTWWWWCMVMCTHNLCVCIPPHQSHPNQTQWCLSCATPHNQKGKSGSHCV